jgi:hypothetical protein
VNPNRGSFYLLVVSTNWGSFYVFRRLNVTNGGRTREAPGWGKEEKFRASPHPHRDILLLPLATNTEREHGQ